MEISEGVICNIHLDPYNSSDDTQPHSWTNIQIHTPPGYKGEGVDGTPSEVFKYVAVF